MGDTTGDNAEHEDQDDQKPDAEGENGDQDNKADDDTESGSESGDDGDDKKSDDDADGDDDKGDKSKKSDDEPDGQDDGTTPPPVRKSPKDYIIARQKRKIAKLKGQDGDHSGDDDHADDEDADDTILDPDDEARISRVVDKKLEPLLETEQQRADKAEEDAFFSDPKNKWAEKDRAKIVRWWQHESRRHLPIRTVALEVAGDRLMKVGAEEERKASDEARRSRNGGHSGRNAGVEKPVDKLTPAEVNQRIAASRARRAEQE